MKKFTLEQMINGWFIGDFEPSILKTTNFEIAVKYYNAGTKELKHLHKVATEITVIVSGKVKVNNIIYVSGDIILIDPNEIVEFEAIEDTSTTVIKTPSILNDKYLI
jgi:hypothetical protein